MRGSPTCTELCGGLCGTIRAGTAIACDAMGGLGRLSCVGSTCIVAACLLHLLWTLLWRLKHFTFRYSLHYRAEVLTPLAAGLPALKASFLHASGSLQHHKQSEKALHHQQEAFKISIALHIGMMYFLPKHTKKNDVRLHSCFVKARRKPVHGPCILGSSLVFEAAHQGLSLASDLPCTVHQVGYRAFQCMLTQSRVYIALLWASASALRQTDLLSSPS